MSFGGAYFNGKDFFRILFTRPTVALYSSGATRDCRPDGKFVLKLLLNPKLQWKEKKNNFNFFMLIFSDWNCAETNEG